MLAGSRSGRMEETEPIASAAVSVLGERGKESCVSKCSHETQHVFIYNHFYLAQHLIRLRG